MKPTAQITQRAAAARSLSLGQRGLVQRSRREVEAHADGHDQQSPTRS